MIEILVVIVVFLVGILGVIQVFPGGLSILRTTRNNTVATSIGRAELERLKGNAEGIAEQILPVSYEVLADGSLRITTDPNRQPRELMPAATRVDPNGEVWDGAIDRGYWPKVSGANVFSRVLGEGRTVPAPRFVGLGSGGIYGGLMTLQFAPIYYARDTGTGLGQPGVLSVYGNTLVRRHGDRQDDDAFNADPPYRGTFNSIYYFVEDDDTGDSDPFQNQDQIWLPRPWYPSGFSDPAGYRVSFTFRHGNPPDVKQFDVIYSLSLDPKNPPAYAQLFGKYWVISVPKLISQPDLYGRQLYDEAKYQGVDYDSLTVARQFTELTPGGAFSTEDPFQFKVLSANLGFLLINPIAFDYKIIKPQGREVLQAKADYTVFDWRIIKDEFRAPDASPYQQKLMLTNLKVLNNLGPDGLRYNGLGITLPGVAGGTNQDFLLLDMESGGIILGNSTSLPKDQVGYTVDKSSGLLTFNDVDNDPSNGQSAYVVFPDVSDPSGWSTKPTLVPDIRGRTVRALYQAVGEWSPHVLKASLNYRITHAGSPASLQAGECYVGGSNDNGDGLPTRIYFPPTDIGRKVVVGEIWYRDVNNLRQVLQDQEFQIRSSVNDPFGRPFVDIRDKDPNATVFDYTSGYAVRRVRGASISVRVLWNPQAFTLGQDEVANLGGLERWMRGWRKQETETFLMGGQP